MKNIRPIYYSFKELFTLHKFFTLSIFVFCIAISLSFGIQVNTPSFFQKNNTFYPKASQEAFVVAYSPEDIELYNTQLKAYNDYKIDFNNFLENQKLLANSNKKTKSKNILKPYLGIVVAEPISPSPKIVNYFNLNKNHYIPNQFNGVLIDKFHHMHCYFENKEQNIIESICHDKSSFLKSIYRTTYSIVSTERFELLKGMNDDDIKKLQPEDLDFSNFSNSYKIIIDKNIMFGNFMALATIGFIIGFVITCFTAYARRKLFYVPEISEK